MYCVKTRSALLESRVAHSAQMMIRLLISILVDVLGIKLSLKTLIVAILSCMLCREILLFLIGGYR